MCYSFRGSSIVKTVTFECCVYLPLAKECMIQIKIRDRFFCVEFSSLLLSLYCCRCFRYCTSIECQCEHTYTERASQCTQFDFYYLFKYVHFRHVHYITGMVCMFEKALWTYLSSITRNMHYNHGILLKYSSFNGLNCRLLLLVFSNVLPFLKVHLSHIAICFIINMCVCICDNYHFEFYHVPKHGTDNSLNEMQSFLMHRSIT